MVVFPNAKINLGLQVVQKRPDGFHDIETVFYPLYKYRDVLEVIQKDSFSNSREGDVVFSTSGFAIDGSTDSNLCLKAYRLLKALFPSLPPVMMHLHKAIPMGAGLGGGSADGAFTLTTLNNRFNLGLKREQMEELALRLGSDCPFFVQNTPALAQGRGERLKTIDLNLSSKTFVIVSPGIHVNTGEAFSRISPSKPARSLEEIVTTNISNWPGKLFNVFEEAIFPMYPEIKKVKDALYESGAQYASMTGTGSTVYGIFNRRPSTLPSFPANYGLMIL